MSLMRPFSSLRDEMNRIFYEMDDFLSPMRTARMPAEAREEFRALWLPPVNIMEEPKRLIVETAIPGLDVDKVEVEVEGNILTVRGEVKREEKEDDKNYHRREIYEGRFQRQVQLPVEVKGESAKAHCENGILSIEIPKSEQTRRHKVKIV